MKRCLYCGKNFISHKRHTKRQKYCSSKCGANYRWTFLSAKEKRKKYIIECMNNPIKREKILLCRKKYNNQPKGRYVKYKVFAKRRNYSWKLTKEQFMSFWNKPCHYCGDKINGIGIDRVDNNKGYSLKNCVSCCGWCNVMKNNYTTKEFITKCEQIIRISKEKYEQNSENPSAL